MCTSRAELGIGLLYNITVKFKKRAAKGFLSILQNPGKYAGLLLDFIHVDLYNI